MKTNNSFAIHQQTLLKQGYWNPAFSFWRGLEMDFFFQMRWPEDITLDVGCGDGNHAKANFELDNLIGFDISYEETRKARINQVYQGVFVADSAGLPLKSDSIRLAVSNSVIEHIERFQEAISDISRVLKPDGEFAITVPSHLFSDYLFVTNVLRALGLHKKAEWWTERKNTVAAHHNLHSAEEWTKILHEHNLEIVEMVYYLPKEAIFCWELPHTFFSKLQQPFHSIFGSLRNLEKTVGLAVLSKPLAFTMDTLGRMVYGTLYVYYRKKSVSEGAGLFIRAKKVM